MLVLVVQLFLGIYILGGYEEDKTHVEIGDDLGDIDVPLVYEEPGVICEFETQSNKCYVEPLAFFLLVRGSSRCFLGLLVGTYIG